MPLYFCLRVNISFELITNVSTENGISSIKNEEETIIIILAASPYHDSQYMAMVYLFVVVKG